MRTKKRLLFNREANLVKNGLKRTKNGYCVNSPLYTTLKYGIPVAQLERCSRGSKFVSGVTKIFELV